MDKFEISREEYISGNIFQVGDLVEDIDTGHIVQILDRGSNYITVQENNGDVVKKWLKDVKPTQNESIIKPYVEQGELVYNGYVSAGLSEDISQLFVEQFEETSDLFAWRHAAFNIELAMSESNLDRKYSFLERAETFFENMKIDVPVYLLDEKANTEQAKIAEMVANLVDMEPDSTPEKTITNAITKLKKVKMGQKEWRAAHKLFKTAKAVGIKFKLSAVPSINITESVDDNIWDLIEDNIDELVDSLKEDDLIDAFDAEDTVEEYYTESELNEVLSIGGRNKLRQKAKTMKTQLAAKRVKKLKRGASTGDLQRRARKLALGMLKKRMFRKAPSSMTRGEKERFERGASKRKALINKLTKRLIGKVRTLQKQRLSK